MIGLSLGLALAGLGVWWLGPSLERMDRDVLFALLKPPSADSAVDARSAFAANVPSSGVPYVASASMPPVATAPIAAVPVPRVVVAPHINPPSVTSPGRVEDLLRPPDGATAQASGTGFFVSSRGTVMTAAHVVDGCRTIRILSRHVPATTAELLAVDHEHDVALLRADVATVPAQLNVGVPVRGTSRVFVLGFPAGAKRDVPDETWATLVNDSFPHSAPLETDARTLLWMQNRDIAQGYSGGPILDPGSGRVVGLVRALIDTRKAELAYGIFMPDLSIGPGAEPLRAALGREPVRDGVVPASFGGDVSLDQARRATVHVYCWL